MANGTAATLFGVTPDLSIPENGIENSSYTALLFDGANNVIDAVFVTDGGAGDAAIMLVPPLSITPRLVPMERSFPPDFSATVMAIPIDWIFRCLTWKVCVWADSPQTPCQQLRVTPI
jgi:hypothetical protein